MKEVASKNGWKLQEIGLILVLFSVPFDELGLISTDMPVIGGLTISKIFIVLTLSIWLMRSVILKESDIVTLPFKNFVTIMVFLFVFASIFSVMNARAPESSISDIIQRISLAIFYLLIINIVRSHRTVKASITVLIIGSTIAAAAGIYELISTESVLHTLAGKEKVSGLEREGLVITSHESYRIQGFAGDADGHSLFLVATGGLVLGSLFIARSRGVRLATLILFLVYVINIIATGSRGGLIGFLICVFVFFIVCEVKRKKGLLAGVILSLLFIYIIMAFHSSVPTIERFKKEAGSDISITFRKAHILMCLDMVRKHPVLGMGIGSFESEYNRFVAAAPLIPKRRPVPSHNAYLLILAENGIIGLTIWLLLIFAVLRGLLLVIKSSSETTIRNLAGGILASFSGYLFCLAVFPELGNEFGFILMGFSTALLNVNREKEEVAIVSRNICHEGICKCL